MSKITSKFNPVIRVQDEPAELDPLQQIQRNWDEMNLTQRAILLSKSNEYANGNRRASMICKASQATLSEATR